MSANEHSNSTSTAAARQSGSRPPVTRNHPHGATLRRWNNRTNGSTPASNVTNACPGAEYVSRRMLYRARRCAARVSNANCAKFLRWPPW